MAEAEAEGSKDAERAKRRGPKAGCLEEEIERRLPVAGGKNRIMKDLSIQETPMTRKAMSVLRREKRGVSLVDQKKLRGS